MLLISRSNFQAACPHLFCCCCCCLFYQPLMLTFALSAVTKSNLSLHFGRPEPFSPWSGRVWFLRWLFASVPADFIFLGWGWPELNLRMTRIIPEASAVLCSIGISPSLLYVCYNPNCVYPTLTLHPANIHRFFSSVPIIEEASSLWLESLFIPS